MNSKRIKLIFLFFISLIWSAGVWAQNFHFIYIQNENKQPFYVKIDKNILSSSPTGYLIIPKLVEGTYPLSIGFLKNEAPELDLTVIVKDIDEGFLLKNVKEKGWCLVSLQNTALEQSQKLLPENENIARRSTGDEFAKVLAEVVNDSSIYYQWVVIEQVDTTVKNAENNRVLKPLVTAVETREWPAQQNSNSEITKLMYDSTADGLLITYRDNANTDSDSVRVFIPFAIAMGMALPEKQIDIPPLAINKEDTVKNDARFIDMELQNPNQKIDSGVIKKDDFVITEKKITVNNLSDKGVQAGESVLDTNKVKSNPDCKTMASQNDFLNLRKKMAAESDEIDMLTVAGEQFSKTCFTTEQIKNLSVLFIIEEEKYKFFVSAFPVVSDTQNFKMLEEQLTDSYYKSRFRAMLSH